MSAAVTEATVKTRGRRRPLHGADPVLVVVSVIIVGIVLVALGASFIAPASPTETNLLEANAAPSGSHLFGTDTVGRDILSRVIYGARLSLLGPAIIVVLSSVVGTAVAITIAWIGGRTDGVVSRGLDILFAFPGLIIALLAIALFGQGLIAPVIALSIAYMPFIARVVRSAATKERRLAYVSALTVAGLSPLRICSRHILPNIAPLILVQSALLFGSALIDLSALSYLGLGVQPPSAEWGLMVSEGQSAIISGNAQESVAAGLAIIVTVVAFNILGERLGRRFNV